jgi:hypothetical protein
VTSQKDVKALIRKLEEQDFTVTHVKSGHYHVRDRGGRLVGTIPCTPSEYRGLKNQIARLRRAGFKDR